MQGVPHKKSEGVSPHTIEVFRNAFINLFSELGLLVNEEMFVEHMSETHTRWLKTVAHYCQPYHPQTDLATTYSSRESLYKRSVGKLGVPTHLVRDEDAYIEGVYRHGMVVQSDIPYRALCAHHLLPVLGRAHVAYIPKDKWTGLSKLSRVVYGIAHSEPSIQEVIGNKVADALSTYLEAVGSACIITAEHSCMGCRGVEEPYVLTTTASLRGVFQTDSTCRQELYNIINNAEVR